MFSVLSCSFGKRAENVFLTLKSYNIDLKIGPDGPSVSYTEREVQDALKTERELDALSAEVACLSNQTCTFEQQKELTSFLGLIDEPGTESLINAQPNDDETLQDIWIVIFGADKTTSAASFEIEKARQLNFELDLVFVDGWYRSVAKFDTEADAEMAKPITQMSMNRPGAYVRLLTR
ncbi:hypothetical protein [Tateyamaria sp. SN3-11]|uniref:hypothetical protein n=1 Tax=Tateyamaria sp. SN3-11 TaxID=3092147 RepID=UPI0039E77C1C